MKSGIMGRTVQSAGWVFGWRLATRCLGLLSTLILLRILAPQDFGLVALGAAFAQTIDALSVLGVEDALIREAQPSRDMYNTAFTMNLLRGLAAGGLIILGSGPVAAFFDEPRLGPLLFVLGALAATDGLINIGIVDFRKDFRFHKEFLLNVVPRTVGVIATIVFALLLHTYWALIAGAATNRLLRTVFSYQMHPFRPRLTLLAWRSLLHFSLWSWVLAIINLLQQRSDAFVVGRISGTAQVGLYSLGAEIALMPSTELIEPLGRAAYSGFSATSRTSDAAAMHVRLLASALVVTLPAGLGLSLVSGPLVRVVMGEHWSQAILPIALLAPAGGAIAVATISAMLLRAKGWVHRVAAAAAAGIAVRVVLMVWLLGRYGVAGAAAGTAIAITAEAALMLVIARQSVGVQLRKLMAQAWRPLAACSVMTGALWATGLGWTAMPADQTWADSAMALAGGCFGGTVAYGSTLALLWYAQGRPQGPEDDILGALAKAATRLRGGLRRGLPRA